MTTYSTMSFDTCREHQTTYDRRVYAQTMTTTRHYSSPTPPLHSYLSLAPKPAIDLCENLLYDVKVSDDVGSLTSSSYVNSSEHYDNALLNTYDNPIEYFENYKAQRSYSHLPYDNIECYQQMNELDNTADDHHRHRQRKEYCSSPASPILVYLENRNLAICIFIISFLLLIVVGLGIFLLNKLLRPVVIDTTVNQRTELINLANSTAEILPLTTATIPMLLVRQMSSETSTTTSVPIQTSPSTPLTCPSDRWGSKCEYKCKPCGLGVCHPMTGNCICPKDIYGEFCDLWKVDDTPKRGDMTH